MGWVMMMRVISSTCSPAVVALDCSHTYFWAFFIIFWSSFWRLTIFSRRHKSQRIKLLYYLLCHGDTQRELFKHPWTQHVLSFISCWVGYLILGGLVHFGKLWLYWSMCCMLISSQPLIRKFYLLILATHFESG